MQALAATGASHVRLSVTWFQAAVNATTISRMVRPGSPLRSVSDAQLAATFATAAALQLQVQLAPQLELDWDLPEVNTPRGAGNLDGKGLDRWQEAPTAVGRGDIGRACVGADCRTEHGPTSGALISEADWDQWFKSCQLAAPWSRGSLGCSVCAFRCLATWLCGVGKGRGLKTRGAPTGTMHSHVPNWNTGARTSILVSLIAPLVSPFFFSKILPRADASFVLRYARLASEHKVSNRIQQSL